MPPRNQPPKNCRRDVSRATRDIVLTPPIRTGMHAMAAQRRFVDAVHTDRRGVPSVDLIQVLPPSPRGVLRVRLTGSRRPGA
jgi:hypothetical protein